MIPLQLAPKRNSATLFGVQKRELRCGSHVQFLNTLTMWSSDSHLWKISFLENTGNDIFKDFQAEHAPRLHCFQRLLPSARSSPNNNKKYLYISTSLGIWSTTLSPGGTIDRMSRSPKPCAALTAGWIIGWLCPNLSSRSCPRDGLRGRRPSKSWTSLNSSRKMLWLVSPVRRVNGNASS